MAMRSAGCTVASIPRLCSLGLGVGAAQLGVVLRRIHAGGPWRAQEPADHLPLSKGHTGHHGSRGGPEETHPILPVARPAPSRGATGRAPSPAPGSPGLTVETPDHR